MLAKLGWALLLACVAFVAGRAIITPYEVTAASHKCAQQFSNETARQGCVDRMF
jgi:hypothetical protein